MELIVFGDVEDALRAHLTTELAELGHSDATVAVTVPHPRPAKLVIVPRLGGARRDLVTETVNIGVEVWAATASAALELAQLVRAVIHATVGGSIGSLTVYRVEDVSGPGLLPDPVTDYPRYVFTVALDVRAAYVS